jgi:hypothetical protein
MSRQNTISQPKALSLTEELEKLEQSITLTLQGKGLAAHGKTYPDESRNRSQLQQSASDSNFEYTADC